MTSRAYIVKQVTKNNCPASIVNNTELHDLLIAGRPHAIIPSVSTVTRDINASVIGYAYCQFISPDMAHGGKRCSCWDYSGVLVKNL
jgi:hypothetical protein